MIIPKEIFKVIYAVGFWSDTSLSGIKHVTKLDEKKIEQILKKLEKEKVAIREYRDKKIYSSKLTEKGQKIFDNKKYLNWKLELGY
jgi:hypothetical protein